VAEIENGLLQLESRRRSRPTPQHPKRPVQVPPPIVATIQPATQRADQMPPPTPTPTPATPPTPALASRRALAPVKATQVYLDEPTMDVLRRCGAAGLIAGTRDVTNSGVIRFAVARLAEQLNPEQIAEAMLDDSNTARRSPGRQRR